MKKLLYVLAAALCLVACERNTPSDSTTTETPTGDTTETTTGNYVDLGLSSGTKWKNANEMSPDDENGFYDYDLAMSLFEKNMPTKEQWMELVNECTWSWTGMGYKVTGPNVKSIVLPAAGYRSCNGSVCDVGSDGDYWSSTPSGPEDTWDLAFDLGEVYMDFSLRCRGLSVRLVR